MAIIGVLGSVALSILTFLLGRVFSRSDKILDQKKTVYQSFLADCPTVNDIERFRADGFGQIDSEGILPHQGILSLFASDDVLYELSEYLKKLQVAADSEEKGDVLVDPKFGEAAHGYNRMVYEMRRDVMAGSFYSLKRLPKSGNSPLSNRNMP